MNPYGFSRFAEPSYISIAFCKTCFLSTMLIPIAKPLDGATVFTVAAVNLRQLSSRRAVKAFATA